MQELLVEERIEVAVRPLDRNSNILRQDLCVVCVVVGRCPHLLLTKAQCVVSDVHAIERMATRGHLERVKELKS